MFFGLIVIAKELTALTELEIGMNDLTQVPLPSHSDAGKRGEYKAFSHQVCFS